MGVKYSIAEIKNLVLSAFLILFVGILSFSTNVLSNISTLLNIAFAGSEEEVSSEEEELSVSALEKTIEEKLPMKEGFTNLSGSVMKTAGVRSFYNEEYGINITKDNYIIGVYPETSTDYEFEALKKMDAFCREEGIDLLYVNAPTKYLDDEVTIEEFGRRSFSNANADKLLGSLHSETEIDIMDLREEIRKEGKNISEMFYRTDHHWTSESGFWAAGKIVRRLNTDFGYGIDEKLFSRDQFEFTYYKGCLDR